jgi:hypothetical protein
MSATSSSVELAPDSTNHARGGVAFATEPIPVMRLTATAIVTATKIGQIPYGTAIIAALTLL